MKKTYSSPKAKIISIDTERFVAASPGVETGSGLGNEYISGDESFSNRRHHSIWDN